MARVPEFRDPFHEHRAIVGGRILNGPPVAHAFPRTQHETIFSGCHLNISPADDGSGKCAGYVISIFDQAENHTYRYSFDERGLAQMLLAGEGLPKVGQPIFPDEQAPKVEEEDDGA